MEVSKISLKMKAFTSGHSFTDIAVLVAVLTSSHWRWPSSCFLAGDSNGLDNKSLWDALSGQQKYSCHRVLKLLRSDGVIGLGKDVYAIAV